jgi:hypothetical protein
MEKQEQFFLLHETGTMQSILYSSAGAGEVSEYRLYRDSQDRLEFTTCSHMIYSTYGIE